jgi:tetratricopeptide (TPR) repeat protein
MAVVTALSLATAPMVPGLSPTVPQSFPGPDDIQNLGAEDFKTREEATRRLWERGGEIEPALRQALGNSDPEVVRRANYLLRRIDFAITPETSPSVMSLVDRFPAASVDHKRQIIFDLRGERAWRQILKLYAREADDGNRKFIRDAVKDVAVMAARDAIVKGRIAEAQEYLELHPSDRDGLLPLADFYRVQGKWEAEKSRAALPEGVTADQWELAFQRVAGNLTEIREVARQAGEAELEAAFALLDGDPSLWLAHTTTPEGPEEMAETYRSLAVKRWNGEEITSEDLEVLAGEAEGEDDDDEEMVLAFIVYFLLGETGPGEKALAEFSPADAFLYFDMLERVPEALAVVGIDLDKPDYAAWVNQRFNLLGGDEAEDEVDEEAKANSLRELASMSGFLERRGMKGELSFYQEPLKALSEKNNEYFLRLLGIIFGNSKVIGALELGKTAALTYAGDDDVRWREVVEAAFSRSSGVIGWWEWLGELDPTATKESRFSRMLTLFRYQPDFSNQSQSTLERCWEEVERLKKQPPEGLDGKKLIARLELLLFLAGETNDVTSALRVYSLRLPPSTDSNELARYRLLLSAAGRWDEAAALWMSDVKADPSSPEIRAYAAANLRRAGRIEEANEQDRWAEKLILGDAFGAARIGVAYASAGDFDRSFKWWDRALILAEPGSRVWLLALNIAGDHRLEEGQWQKAAAYFEALTFLEVNYERLEIPPAVKLRVRVKADFCRAMADLSKDRKGAIARLKHCHQLLIRDGFLADHFFPALRKAGLTEQHDLWFEQSWAEYMNILKLCPDSDNTKNTAAWLASRATRRLDEAEALVKEALGARPGQSAYLDTLAEIHFARKNRAEALKWSRKAIDSDPLDEVLRQQYQRFESAPFP